MTVNSAVSKLAPSGFFRIGALCALLSSFSLAADLPTAKTIAADMGFGWNLGNTLETPSGTPVSYWSGHNPTQATFNAVKAAGFKSVRIPCAWSSHANASTNVIDTTWLAEVKRSVDFAINAGLYAIINIHWDGGWLEDNVTTGSQASVNVKQKAYWTQIANYFKVYDQHLLFAGANEPAHKDAWAEDPNTVFPPDRIAVLNSYYQTFIDAVRGSGGNNASRTLIIQGPHTDIEFTNKVYNTLPTDKIADRLMLEVHFYPYPYTLMTADADWSKQFFYWGSGNHSTTDTDHNPTWGEEAYVDQVFQLMKTQFVDKGIPTIIGEWGAGYRSTLSGDNLALHKKGRLAFYKYVQKAAKSRGLIPFAWDTNYKGDMNMTIINRESSQVYDLDLMNAMRSGWDMGAVSVEARGTVKPSSLQVTGSRATYLADAAAPATVSLKDIQGRTLWSQTFAGKAGLNTVDLPSAHKGLAIVQVQQGDESVSGRLLAD
jgi:endoglucanase